MDVYWFEQTQADVPNADDWLSTNEVQFLSGLRFPKRRSDWLLGRWTAKNALAICLGLFTKPETLREIEIRPTPSGAPEAFVRNQPAAATLSLSHRAGVGACTVVASRVALGCDLEWIEPRSAAFAADYFAPEEQALIANATVEDRDPLLALLWSGKESALKALRDGLRRDTRSVIVTFSSPVNVLSALRERSLVEPSLSNRLLSGEVDWNQLCVRAGTGETFCGWWTQSGSLLRTLVAAPPFNPPVLLSQKSLAAR